MPGRAFTDEQLIEAVAKNDCLVRTMKDLRTNYGGGSILAIKRHIVRLKLDVSHWVGRGWRKRGNLGPKRPIEDYLSNKCYINTHELKKRLIREGLFKHKCYECELEIWRDKPIPIQLHHIDGDRYNNNLSNLTILCPNCHAQTETFCGKNKPYGYKKGSRGAKPTRSIDWTKYSKQHRKSTKMLHNL